MQLDTLDQIANEVIGLADNGRSVYLLSQESMSFDEIVEEVPKLTGEERHALRSYHDQYEAIENDVSDEGLRYLKEEPNDQLRGIGSAGRFQRTKRLQKRLTY